MANFDENRKMEDIILTEMETSDCYQFYTEYLESGFTPGRIDDSWLSDNDEYLRELIYVFFCYYKNMCSYSDLDREFILNTTYKLFSESILSSYTHFKTSDTEYLN